jgi:hypothetical protein
MAKKQTMGKSGSNENSQQEKKRDYSYIDILYNMKSIELQIPKADMGGEHMLNNKKFQNTV